MRSILILLCFAITNVYSQQVLLLKDGGFAFDRDAVLPNREISYEHDGVVVTYMFNEALLFEFPKQTGSYLWKIAGFGTFDFPGNFALPFRNDAFTIPKGYYAELEILDSSYVDFKFNLALACRPQKGTLEISDNSTKEMYSSPKDIFSPISIVTASKQMKYYRGNSIYTTQVCPIQYEYSTQTVRAYTLIKYKVKFVSSNASIISSSTKSIKNEMVNNDSFLNNITLNGDKHYNVKKTKEQSSQEDVARDYLIISTNKYADAVNSFAEWKKLLGFRVHTILKESWISSEDVKSAIVQAYNNLDALYYLLIVGDHEDVPGQFSEINADDGDFSLHYTDWFYGCMDWADDDIPDIYRGRIPVSNLEEANTVLNKIITYEKEPPSENSFYNTGVNCAYFEDRNEYGQIDGREERRFTLTSEEIKDYLESKSKTVKHVYSTEFEVYPTYWNNTYFANGGNVPEYIRKPNYQWTGNADSIINAINNGAFYVMYRGHGMEQFWYEPFFNSQSIQRLSNGNKLPVVFSIACLTGIFNEDCFAEKFLKHPNGGCVAIFAASDTGYSGYDDALVEGMFDAIWPSPGLRPTFPGINSTGGTTPAPTYTLGQILDQGQARLSETFGSADPSVSSNPINDSFCRKVNKEIFHCFGDPSMQIYTECPTTYSDVIVERTSTGIVVKTNNEISRITFYNHNTNEIKSYLSTQANYYSENMSDVDVCVSAHNKIPYINKCTTICIQNKVLNGPLNIIGDKIIIGSSVTSEEPEGPVIFNSGEITLTANEIVMESGVTINKGVKLNTIIK